MVGKRYKINVENERQHKFTNAHISENYLGNLLVSKGKQHLIYAGSSRHYNQHSVKMTEWEKGYLYMYN